MLICQNEDVGDRWRVVKSLLVIAVLFLLLLISEVQADCDTPLITNCPSERVSSRGTVLEYQFGCAFEESDGDGNIYWQLCKGVGSIDSLSGLFRVAADRGAIGYALLRIVNDCAVPRADTCFLQFELVFDDSDFVIGRDRTYDGMNVDGDFRSDFVYGPADAESISVYIQTTGSASDLDALGIKYYESFLSNIYMAKISMSQLAELHKKSSVLRLIPMSRRGDKPLLE
jgi:hypothetical protein